jgi:hypothetical protein
LVLVAGDTGLRWGVTGLRARRVKPFRGRVDVVEAVIQVVSLLT